MSDFPRPGRGKTKADAAHGRASSDGSRGERTPERAALPPGNALHRLLIDSVRDYAIFALDADGYIVTWNSGAERVKGFTAEEAIGRHFSMLYPPEDVAAGKPERELKDAAKDGRIEDEGWRLRKDGSRFWANVVITALHNEHGELVGYAKVTRDLTERRQNEEALRQSEERFRLLVQHVVDYGIFMLDPAGNIASWNEGAERIQGYTATEIIGRHFSVFYPSEDLAAGKPQMELSTAARVGRFEDEGWRLHKNGSRFWANVVITAMRDHTSKLLGFTKVVRDLTERRAAEERAISDARRVAEVESANRTKSEFLTALSHELRTPLNAIGGYTDLLLMGVRGALNDEQRTDLERIRRSQQHLLLIINDLLNFSRIDAGHVTYDIQRVKVDALIEGVTPMIEPQATGRGLGFAVESCSPDFVVLADPVKAEQILLNLLSNAVKFTETGGLIEVFCIRESDHIQVAVRDTGIGIPAERLDDIFEPFVQLGRSLISTHEGTGLGLAISRDLARAMGGDLTVTSVVGKGSTFTLTLPAA